jgi:hypothetical protein
MLVFDLLERLKSFPDARLITGPRVSPIVSRGLALRKDSPCQAFENLVRS